MFRSLIALATIATLPATAADPWRLVGQQGVLRFVVVEAGAAKDESTFRRAAAEVCNVRKFPVCNVSFWTDASKAATSSSFSDAQQDAVVAQWHINMNTGYRQWHWDCRLPKLIQEAECFPPMRD